VDKAAVSRAHRQTRTCPTLLNGPSRIQQLQSIQSILKKITTSGQSCGGLQAIHVGAQDPRVKVITVFNSGSLNAKDTALAKQVKVPIAYFLGGPSDIAFKNGQKDYTDALPPSIPALLATINSGHMGTYFQANGGTYGKIAVAWLNWQFKNDASAKALLLSPGSALTKDGWTIQSRNFK